MDDVQQVYCPGCNHKVRLTQTEAPPRSGHANLPDGAELVCLDFGEGCSEGRCPLTGSPGMVMGVRLAKSHLNDEVFSTITARCDSCQMVAEMEILNDKYAFCPLCESTNRWVMLRIGSERVAVTVR